MFSRTLLSDKKSEKIATHQRLIRIARHQTIPLLPANVDFPTAKQMIRFEGANGPDGLPGKHSITDEPHQFIDPAKNDKKLFQHIKNHLYNAHQAYKRKNQTRFAFELAWLSHMVIDGLTPAHQQPFKDKLKELDPRTAEEVNSLLKRIFMPGASFRDIFEKNWQRLGPRGLGTNHILFEAGIDFIVMPIRPRSYPNSITVDDIKKVKAGRFLDLYWKSIQEISKLRMFERYEESSWTTELATEVREKLIPVAVRMVVLSWLAAVYKGK